MDFIENWQQAVKPSLAKCAALASEIEDVDLEYALMAVGVLGPLRQPVQEFDMKAIEAVNKLLGQQAKHILRSVQTLDADPMTAARDLNLQIGKNPELDTALNVLVKHFRAFFIFADELSKQVHRTGLAKAESMSRAEAVSADVAEATTARSFEVVTRPSTLPPRVFVSYARSDGEDLARELTQRLEREGIPVWQDRVSMEGGRDWWLQITDALNQVEFMVLIMTTAALNSSIVRKEWTYARQQGVCVYPVQGEPGLNFDALPRWMRNVHFYNLQLEWPKLLEDLRGDCRMPRVPFMVEDLPEDFVLRSGQIDQLLSLFLDAQGDPIANSVGLHGTGGYGKTMLAKAICHDENINQAFDDGILWVTLGEDPGDLTGRVIDFIEVLSGERPGFSGLDAAESRLVQLLADRDILMVIDDVWNVAHLKSFLLGGARCARLITTRNVAALPPRTHNIEVSAMTSPEAVDLLKVKLPDGPSGAFQELADRLGHWPLLLKLANGTLRDRVHKSKQTITNALAYVNKALDKRGLTAFDAHNAAARDQAISQTLAVSLDLLSADERARYGEMTIFPDDVQIPLAILEKLWGATANLDDFDVEELCERLSHLSLLSHFDPNSRYVTVHNIIKKYLAQDQGNELSRLHDQFLQACAVNLPLKNRWPKWADLPQDNAYLWTHLAYHLIQANREAELIDTVKDLGYLMVKMQLRGAYTAEADLLVARKADPNDTVLTRLHQTISQASHLLNQSGTLTETANVLHSRLAHEANLADLLANSEPDLPKPLLTAYRRLPDLPDSSLIRTLAGHGVPVVACDMSADGSTIISMGRNAEVKIWDVETGAERFSLAGHMVMGNSCALNGDGSMAVSATWDGTLIIWDTRAGAERFSIKAHADQIFDCAISANGATVVTASKDKTLKVWDADTGQERFILTGHERSVTGCAISADGSVIASVSPDGNVKLWNGQTGKLQSTINAFEVEESINPVANLTFTAASSTLLSCAMNGAGSILVCSTPDSRLKVWDARTMKEYFTLEGHTGWIESCAMSDDSRLVVSTSNDKIIKGWDTHTGSERFSLEGHTRAVTDSAICADGSMIVTASQDKSLRLWDVQRTIDQAKIATFGRVSSARCCAVSADGQTIVCDASDNALAVIEAETGRTRLVLKGHMRPVTGCVLSRDGALIVSSSQDRTVKAWETQTGRERFTLHGHMWAVNDCAVSLDGSTIVSASEDSTLKVWDASTGAERFTLSGHLRGVNGCAISPDGSLIASASADKTVKIWDARAARQLFTLPGHTGPVNSCAISPNGELVVSASNDDTLRVWNLKTGELRSTLEGHTGSVSQGVFSPDSKFIISVSKDDTFKLWDATGGRCITTLRVDGSLFGCAWFPNGKHILGAGARGIYFLQFVG